MIRTFLAIVGISAAILWLPLWVQLALLALGVIVLPYRLALFIPAVFADALYAPGGVSLVNMKYTLITAALILAHWVIVHKTRVKDIYAVETK